jgi:hypothetical protein
MTWKVAPRFYFDNVVANASFYHQSKPPINDANLNFISKLNGCLEMGSTRDRSMPPSIKGFADKGTGFLTVTLRAGWTRRVSNKSQIQINSAWYWQPRSYV